MIPQVWDRDYDAAMTLREEVKDSEGKVIERHQVK